VEFIETIYDRVYNPIINIIADFIRQKRNKAGLTQEELALYSGLVLHFVREFEQSKKS